MAEENPSKPSQTGSSGSGRKGNRRRYSRNRKRSRKSRGDSNDSPREEKGATTAGGDGSQRARRDRRRRRSKRTGETQNASRSRTTLDDDLGVLPVGSVSVYTHVIRPSIRDSYEFRSEHFSKVSRKLEDFKIDLSLLFPEEQEAGQEDDVPPDEEANGQAGIID